MQNDYSLDSLSEFVQKEAQELDALGLSEQEEGPSENAVQNILNYSKQLSVRKSVTLGVYEQNLN